MNNANKNRKSHYNPDRACYLTSDGKYYCYEIWDEESQRLVTQRLEVGKDLSVELTLVLDSLDHDADLNDRYAAENHDALFEAKLTACESSVSADDAPAPWETIESTASTPEQILFAEEPPENPQIALVRQVIEDDCTEAQQAFFYEHFGMQMQLEEIRQAEAAATGKLPTPQAMNNRKNKILDKVAHSLGVERIKRRRTSSKD